MLIRDIIVRPHHAVRLDLILQKPVVLRPRHAVVYQILVHDRVYRTSIGQVQGQKPLLVQHVRRRQHVWGCGMKILRRLALNKYRVRADLQDRPHRHRVRPAQVAQGRDEPPITGRPLVPPPELPRERRRHEDLVDRRVVPHPGKTHRERPRVLGEQGGPVRVVEAADPVGHPKVAQINDRRDSHSFERPERLVRKAPVIPTWPDVGREQRRPVAQEFDVQFLYQPEVVPPARIVPALRHLIHPQCPPVRQPDRGVTVLDPRRKHELAH